MFWVEITNKSVYDKTGEKVSCWLSLPATIEEINEAMNKIGVTHSNEFFISNFETDLEELKELNPYHLERESIDDLNEQICKFENLSDRNKDVVATILEWREYSLREALKIVESQKFIFWGVNEFNSLGDLAFSLFNAGLLGNFSFETNLPFSLVDCIDFERLGESLTNVRQLLNSKRGAVWFLFTDEEELE